MWPSQNILWVLVNFLIKPNSVDARVPAGFLQCLLQVKGILRDISRIFAVKVIFYFRQIADCIFCNVIKQTALKRGTTIELELGDLDSTQALLFIGCDVSQARYLVSLGLNFLIYKLKKMLAFRFHRITVNSNEKSVELLYNL